MLRSSLLTFFAASLLMICGSSLALAEQTTAPVPVGPGNGAPAGVTQTPAPPAPAAQTTQVQAPPSQTISLADGYIIGVGDVIQVAVLGRAEFNVRVQVQNDGTIQLPYLLSVLARDSTVLQLRDLIRQRLKAGGFYTDPAVEVGVVGFTARYVTILGEVAQPGLLPIDRTYRVSEVLAKVGGVRATSDDRVLLRRATGEELSLSVQEVAIGGPDRDPIVNPGDKIYIAAAPTFYIYGQIASPGSYKVERDMTLRQALARGGGLTERGSDKRIKMFRNGQEVRRVPLSEPIKGGDTVVIGERLF